MKSNAILATPDYIKFHINEHSLEPVKWLSHCLS